MKRQKKHNFNLISRESKNRDGCLSCITLPANYTPNKFGSMEYSQLFFEKIYARLLVKLPVKVSKLLKKLKSKKYLSKQLSNYQL